MSRTLNAELDTLEDEGLLGDEDALYDAFTEWAGNAGTPLYPHQEESLLELLTGNHLVVETPTGSGKSMIALAGHFVSLARGGRSYYTAPLKALVSEKFFDLVDVFGAENVGMVTGDVSLNAEAPIICCTAEILANQALREGNDLDADMVIMDEFHFYSDPQRGWAWQVPLLELAEPQYVFLSATLGDSAALRAELAARTDRDSALIDDAERPVPLEFDYIYEPLETAVEQLVKEDRAPIYIVHFAQADAVKTAVDLARTVKLPEVDRRAINQTLKGTQMNKGFGKTLRDLLGKGIAVHHAGMLPRYRRAVERLARQGLLLAVCGTDTLGVGINVPIRTVLFTSLVKYDGRRERHLSAREFHQISGRAGRPGFDTVGYVRTLASETELDAVRRRAKLTAAQEAGNKKKQRQLARKRPRRQQDGEMSWTKGTFDRLTDAQPETLHPRFATSHAMILNVLQGDNPEARLLRLAEEARHGDKPGDGSNRFLRELGDIYRSLIQAELVERRTNEDGERELVVVGDLPDDFALNQPLAPFALAALDLLDPLSPSYALDVVSVIESVMENPRALLFAQRKQARDEAFQVLRDEGFDFHERRDMVAEITWPQPLSEVIMPAFETFARTNPWVKGREPSPKRVLREMVEDGQTFSSLISKYGLENAEGSVLRYLSDTYRALQQILPEEYVTPEVEQIVDWLKELLSSVDSSLLTEWEDLLEGRWKERGRQQAAEVSGEEAGFGQSEDGRMDYSINPHAMRTAIRNRMFRWVEAASQDDADTLGEANKPDWPWDADRWHNELGHYWDAHEYVRIDQPARSADLFSLRETPTPHDLLEATGLSDPEQLPKTSGGDYNWWVARQIVLDPEETGEWHLVGLVDVPATLAKNEVTMWPASFGPYGDY